jgi:hypothetical protein
MAKLHLLSYCQNKAFNAARRGPITAGLDEKGDPRIFVRGRFSPAVDRLMAEIGLEEAWNFLKDTGVAYGAISDQTIPFLGEM